jgi:hypothetical protein
MAIKVTYSVKSVADASATFSSVDDCKDKLSIGSSSELENVASKQTKANEWAIDSDGNVTFASFYANTDDRDVQKQAYLDKVAELSLTRKYDFTEVSVEEL